MQLVVLANDSQREELLSCGLDDEMKLTFVNVLAELQQYSNADCIIDLLFDGSSDRIAVLRSFPTVIINSVIDSLSQLNVSFVRINGWPGFLQRPMVEASCNITHLKQQAENIFASFNKQTCWLQDKTGFVTARVVAMIINEAWFALQENVSTKSEIDIAMRLGTNYPFGPFEWCERIGVKNIYGLLNELAKTDSRYEPAALLKKEATQWLSS
jgi:3-hydroxybutyryl-CoA dehydrogenase